jgi:hypothetical protein
MADKTIPLVKPLVGHGETYKEIVLREPAYAEIMELGEPTAYARDDSGMVYTAEKDSVIRAYIERLVVSPKDPLLLQQCGAADTLKLRDAVHGFFQTARSPASA